MAPHRRALTAAAVGYLARLRFPTLFVIALAVLGLDLLLPDGLPSLDEIILGVGAAFLGSWKKQRGERQEGEIIDAEIIDE